MTRFRKIIKENYTALNPSQEVSIKESLEADLKNCPEGYDNFFIKPFDELTTEQQEERFKFLLEIITEVISENNSS